MRRVVVDTNCLLASVSPASPFYRLYTLFATEVFEWVVSNEILTEYEEILARYYSPSLANKVLTILCLAPNVLFQEAYYHLQLIEADPDDNKFVDVAFAAGADVLVTNDRHFDVLRQIPFPKVQTMTLQEFVGLYDNSDVAYVEVE